MRNNKSIVISEFGYLVKSDEIKKIDDAKFQTSYFINKKSFEILKKFNYKNDEQIFKLTSYNKKDDAFQASSYVGVIELKNGVYIEILPKIYTNEGEEKYVKKVFLKMLSKLRYSKFSEFGLSHLRYKDFPLLEVFVILFVEKVIELIMRGLRGDYVNFKSNQGYLRGKLLFNEQIKNIVHKERFFLSYDEFSINTHANRIIKTTLFYLLKKGFSIRTEKLLRQLLFVFSDIGKSKNIDSDFQKAFSKMRLFKDYESVLNFCKIFLNREAFVNFKGKEYATAILFPMEKIFEDYVAYLFKKYLSDEYNVKIQAKSEFLLKGENNKGKFKLIPDILLTKKNSERIIVDTKWKLIDEKMEEKNYYVSEGDLYQMYAYAKKYRVNRVILLYPENQNFKSPIKKYKFEKDISLSFYPFPISEIDDINKEKIEKIINN